jgi:MOSC domain-containing protein YiiM
MSGILKIGLTKDHNKEIIEVNEINLIAGKGIVGDRHFRDFNDPFNQLSIIESENIDEYNLKNKLSIPYLNFRRNIVTKGIKLNELLNKNIKIGSVKLDVIDLCRPCRHLSEKLGRDDIIKEFLRKGGIRCQIINDGKISVTDKIKVIQPSSQ